MIKLEFEHLIERPISDEEFRKIQLVYMNTEAIVTPLQMSHIYLVWGEKGIDILYSLVMERGRLIEEVGELKRELSNVKKENRRLQEFRGVILKAYEEGQHMELKTMQGWHEYAEKNSDGSWNKYCKPGDLVDEEVYDYFLDILPPRSMSRGYLQVGEPYSSAFDPETRKWRQTYSTFQRVEKGVWMYLGNCFPGGSWDPETFVFDRIRDFLKKTYRLKNGEQVSRPHIYCKDGFHFSIQAGAQWYCQPRKDLESGEYDTAEIGGLPEREELLLPYAEEPQKPTKTVYAFVPVSVVEEIIVKHGGVVRTTMPVV